MKKFAWFLSFFVSLIASMQLLIAEEKEENTTGDAEPTIHSCKAKAIDGTEIDFAKFKGKALLIVNTASKCGVTDQYEGLQAIHEYFGEKGLVVLAFPTNDFGEQETGSNDEIQKFCKTNYDISFPLIQKGPVKGEKKHAVFKYLTQAKNPDREGEVGWNFEKFLVGKDGKLKRRFTTSVDPFDKAFLKAVYDLLGMDPKKEHG